MSNAMILILTLLISRVWMATFLVAILIVFTFLNLFGLQKCLVIPDVSFRNTNLTAKLLQQGYRYNKLWKVFSKVYGPHYELVSRYDTRLKHFCYKAIRSFITKTSLFKYFKKFTFKT